MAAKRKRRARHPAEKYVDHVLSGKQVACHWVRRACARHLHDLEHGHERGLYFDPDAAAHIVEFFSYLHHSKGKWAGTPIKLEPWQQFGLWCLFGWKREETGLRRFRTAYESVARKNGKSTKNSGIGLYGLTADGELGAEIYAAATKRDQARIIHGEAVRMRSASPFLRKLVGAVKDNLHVIETNSKFEPLGKDKDTLDGLNVHFALIDELHAHKDRGIYDLLDTATSAREQPLIYSITTAGVDKSPRSICWEQHKYGLQILDGFDKPDGLKDDTFFAYIFTLDQDDDPFDETVWVKANPNLGVSVNIDDLRRKALKAKESPAALNTFLRLHMNVWTDAFTIWVPLDRWDACAQSYTEEDLEGEDCFGGLDLSSTRDVAAMALVFPREEIEEIVNPLEEGEGEPEIVESLVVKYRTLFRFWVPEVMAETRSRRDQVMYQNWIQQGWMRATEGDVCDYDVIRRDINEDFERFNIRQIAVDRWNSTQLVTQLQGDGLTVVPFGQGFASMNAPTKEVEKLILSRHIEHNSNPVIRWMLGNVAIKHDPAGNQKPDKEKSVEKIDGVVALIMAIGTAMVQPPEQESVYVERGLRTV